MTDRSYRGAQIVLVATLSALSALVLWGPLVARGALYWDHAEGYSVFRDSLHSLSTDGETQWWTACAEQGFPAYYLSRLGFTGGSPLFVAVGAAVWTLGRLGLEIQSFHLAHVLYFGFLVPLLLGLSMLALARHILRRPLAVTLVVVLTAFSPGVFFSFSDMGVELTAYGLFVLAAFARFERAPGRATFLAFAASSFLAALSVGHLFLYWNVHFIPISLLTCVLIGRGRAALRIRALYGGVPRWYWLATAAGLAVCVLPTWLVYSDGANLVRSTSGTRVYSYEKLSPGNSLEAFGISVPGLSLTSSQGAQYSWLLEQAQVAQDAIRDLVQRTDAFRHVSYTYLGVSALPLAIVGLLWGRRPWRQRLAILISIDVALVTLSGFSPFWSVPLLLVPPLRAVNHYSDTTFRLGLGFLIILAAALGLEVLLAGRRGVPRAFRRIFGVTFVLGIVACVGVFALRVSLMAVEIFPRLGHDLQAGVVIDSFSRSSLASYSGMCLAWLITMGALLALTLAWLTRAKTAAARRRIVTVLVGLCLLDVTTAAHVYVRHVAASSAQVVEMPSETAATSCLEGRSTTYASELLSIADIETLAGTHFHSTETGRRLFQQGAVLSTRVVDSLPEAELDSVRPGAYVPAVMVAPADVRGTPFARFAQLPAPVDDLERGHVEITRVGHNVARIAVEAPVESLLVWRDAYSPHWHADVDGHRQPVARAFGAYKAVVVPAGRSIVTFRFSPTGLRVALAVAWLVVAAVVVLWLRERRQR